MDYPALFDILRAANYTGWQGIEYEGDGLPPGEGIRKNLELARRSWLRNPVLASRGRARIDSTLRALVGPGGAAGVSALVNEQVLTPGGWGLTATRAFSYTFSIPNPGNPLHPQTVDQTTRTVDQQASRVNQVRQTPITMVIIGNL